MPIGAATKPLSTPTAGMPTMKLATSNAPVGAPTIALKTAGLPPLGTATPTALSSPSAQTASLPKATVSLNPPTKPLSPVGSATKPLSPISAGAKTIKQATLSTSEQDDIESGASGFTKILAGVGLAAAILVLSLQLKMSNIWLNADDFEYPGDWMQILKTP
jgi:hypothetical protein